MSLCLSLPPSPLPDSPGNAGKLTAAFSLLFKVESPSPWQTYTSIFLSNQDFTWETTWQGLHRGETQNCPFALHFLNLQKSLLYSDTRNHLKYHATIVTYCNYNNYDINPQPQRKGAHTKLGKGRRRRRRGREGGRKVDSNKYVRIVSKQHGK